MNTAAANAVLKVLRSLDWTDRVARSPAGEGFPHAGIRLSR